MGRRRLALVTGASRGIGRAIAERLAVEGYDLTISARSKDALDEVAGQLRSLGSRVEVVAADLADLAQVDSVARTHVQAYECLDVLVLAAGMGFAGELGGYPIRRLDAQVAVNLRAPFLLVQQLLPALRKSAASSPDIGARVVAIASIIGVASEPGLAAYGATKAALISLCESITAAEGTRGVSATAISPGYVNTDMAAWVHDRVDPAEMIQATDIAELTLAVSRLSRHAAVPNIVVTRPGSQLWRA